MTAFLKSGQPEIEKIFEESQLGNDRLVHIQSQLEIKKSSKQTRDGVLKSESQSTDLHSKSTRDQHRFFEVQSMEFNNKEIRYYIQRQVP